MTHSLKSVFFLMPLMAAVNLSAQKPDREKLGYYNYQQPPASDALSNAEYFLLEVDLEDNDAYRRKLVEQEFDGGPFKMADTENEVDFSIKITEGKFSYSTPAKKTYAGRGAETKYYKGDVRYHYTLKVYNKNGEEILGTM
ncbi:MAG: hypothetical protein U5L96_00465 [Owenweeksia sp.]|nr:hypothetical protein [Owenweeksia sp.]